MARRRSDDTFTVLWDLFMVTPWWVCPIVAGGAYLLLLAVFPPLFSAHPALKAFAGVSSLFAPWAAGIILIIGLFAWLRRWSGGLLLDGQSGLDTIKNLSWREFEELIAAAYRRQGYRVIETGGVGADGGIDLILVRDGEKVLVQCKHWRSSKVGVTLVRELHGLTHCKEHQGSRGLFVTFGTYTPDAARFAKDNGIEIVDRKILLQMIQSAQSGDHSPQSSGGVSPLTSRCCPLCGSPMTIRTARRGDRAGSRFWGCTCYPACRGIIDC